MLEFETVLSKGRNIRLHPTGFIQVDIQDGPFEIWGWNHKLSNDMIGMPPVIAFSATLEVLVERGAMIHSTPTVVGAQNGYYKKVTLHENAAVMGESGFDITSNWIDETHTITRVGGKFTFPQGQPRRIFGYTHKDGILAIRKSPDEFVSTHMLIATSVNQIDLSRFQISPKRLWECLEEVF